MDLDLRKLRYFAAVAEHEHFGRAAEQLYIAQPVLSRQIRSLEQDLGCALLERTTRSVRLTPAGRQLQHEAADLLVEAADAARRVHQAARGGACLVVGFAPGLSVAAAVRAYETEQPGINIQLLRLNWYEQAESLRDGRADVGYLRRPFDAARLRITTIGSEPSVVCLPADHPLASKPELLQADLADQTTLDAQVRRTTTVEEKLELVAVGRGLAVLPRSVAEYYARPDLAYRQLSDAPAHDLCLATVKGRRQPHLLRFVAAAATALSPVQPHSLPAGR
jgi:DNA-binding transcriptional LysR family regulator